VSYPFNNPVDVLSFPGSGNNNAGLHSYGSIDGNFGSRSSGYGGYDVAGSFRIVQTITNSSSVAQAARFNFFITPGLLSNDIGSALTGSEFVSAGLKFDVQLNGSSIWGSSATLTSNAAGTSLGTTGDSSLYSGSGAYYSVDGISKSVDLGVINAGGSVTLSYELDSFARGSSSSGPDRVVPETTYHVPDQWIAPGCAGYGELGVALARVAVAAECGGDPVFVAGHDVTVPAFTVAGAFSGSHGSSGDPFDIDFGNGSPFFNTNAADPFGANVILSSVPEPSTYALMLGGLGLVGWAARRRRSAV
jgi:hypothetical protein